jgi:hypothetical protein
MSSTFLGLAIFVRIPAVGIVCLLRMLGFWK